MQQNTLFRKEDMMKATKLEGLLGRALSKVLMSTLGINKANKLCENITGKDGPQFIEALLDSLDISLEMNMEELNRIPETGPFVTVSNYPFGSIDGMLLIYLVSKKRPDYKVAGNLFLSNIQPLDKYLISPSPNAVSEREIVVDIIKQCQQQADLGGGVGLFPASEISTLHRKANKAPGITDKQWEPTIIKLIKKAEVPIVPVYFSGKNSASYHLLRFIAPMLQSAKLPSEMVKKKNKPITVRVGQAISVEEQNEFKDIEQYGRFLRNKTYALGSTLDVKKFFKFSHHKRKKVKPESIVPLGFTHLQINEVKALKQEYLLFEKEQYSVIMAPAVEMPDLLNEIGRLREIEARETGESIFQRTDLDEYDLYYHHLFVWDEDKKCVAAACRVGLGDEILETYGEEGFALNSLFKSTKPFLCVLEESINVERSFVADSHKEIPLVSQIIWNGILYSFIKNTKARYLIAPINISRQFSRFSKSILLQFIQNNFINSQLSEWIIPRNKFKLKFNGVDTETIIQQAKQDIEQIDKFIGEIEKQEYHLPDVLKRVMEINGKILCFSRNPRIPDCVNGLLAVDKYEIPANALMNLADELNDDSIFEQ